MDIRCGDEEVGVNIGCNGGSGRDTITTTGVNIGRGGRSGRVASLCVVLAEPLLGRLSSDSAALEVPSLTSTHLDSEGKKELVTLEF
ncbi:hypothetical protein Pmani_001088 [Petrolisthes manimaculis]|uniref:Uncharacterized protein n=1 Tax=Petrolisthes manimaculis TaxID=1843537 RepID=A0AAE1UKM0_9EUCA|nr:hypothetical protein Pmani_001088 [Petrolisthes manimaculis]